jgi:hypothetical protein
MANELPRKAWTIRAFETVGDLTNSLARKLDRGEFLPGQEIVAEHTGHCMTSDGQCLLITTDIVFIVTSMQKIRPQPIEHIEVLPVRE